jgi:hypothetical protein
MVVSLLMLLLAGGVVAWVVLAGSKTQLESSVDLWFRSSSMLRKANDPRKCLTHLRGSAEFSRAPGGAQQESVFASRPYGRVRVRKSKGLDNHVYTDLATRFAQG